MTPKVAAQPLLDTLLTLESAGPGSFEDLCRALVADVAGQPLRLARSGDQEGADAASADGNGGLRVETKLYRANTHLDRRSLLGELTEARLAVEGRPLTWILLCTREIPNQTREALAKEALEQGIHVPVIDWMPDVEGTPVLAGLVRAASRCFLTWWQDHVTEPLAEQVRDYLAPEPDPAQREAFKTLLSPGVHHYLGIRDRIQQAYLDAMADPVKARAVFGQALAPLAHTLSTVDRPKVEIDVNRAIAAADADKLGSHRVLSVVLGAEGVGKTWAVAQHWLDRHSQVLMLFLSAQDIDDHRALELCFAKAMERATGARFQRGLDDILRDAGAAGDRVYLVVDGLNENTEIDWPMALSVLTELAITGKAVPIVTCRPRVWEHQIEPRLHSEHTIYACHVGDYTRSELEQAFAARGLDPETVPEEISDGLANPRYCKLALDLIEEVGPIGLTRDRVLWHYWRRGLGETHDLAHTDEEFRDLLIDHARHLLASSSEAAGTLPSPVFRVTALRDRSDTAYRQGAMVRDLEEIVDGRFFQPAARQGHKAYRFKATALVFALGLELVERIAGPAEEPADNLQETLAGGQLARLEDELARIVEPIEGLDRTAEILVAALGVAALKGEQDLVQALLLSILDLRNRTESLLPAFMAYLGEAFEGYAAAAEAAVARDGQSTWIAKTLRAGLEGGIKVRADSRRALDARIEETVGRWIETGLDNTLYRDFDHEADDADAPVDPLRQLACQVIAGHSLAGVSGALAKADANPATLVADRRLLVWLRYMDRSDGSVLTEGADLPVPGIVDAPPDVDESFVIQGDVDIREYKNLDPGAASRVLENHLVRTPVDQRVALLRSLPLPDRGDFAPETWSTRPPWRPDLGPSGPSTWILSIDGDPGGLRAACLYLAAKTNVSLTNEALDVLARHTVTEFAHLRPEAEDTQNGLACAALAVRSGSSLAGRALGEAGWTVRMVKADPEFALAGSRVLATACAEPGAYERLRGRLAPAALSTVLEVAPTAELPMVVDDMIAASKPEHEPVSPYRLTADGGWTETGVQPTLDLVVKLACPLPPSAAAVDRLARHHPDCILALADIPFRAELSLLAEKVTGTLRALLPALVDIESDLAVSLATRLRRWDIAKRNAFSARSPSLNPAVHLLAANRAPGMDIVIRDTLADASEDGDLLRFAVDVVEAERLRPGTRDPVVNLLKTIVEDGRPADQARASIVLALLGEAIPSRLSGVVSEPVVRIQTARAAAFKLWADWRAEPNKELETALFAAGWPFFIPDPAPLPRSEIEDLMLHRLWKLAGASPKMLADSLFDRDPPPAWLSLLNAGS